MYSDGTASTIEKVCSVRLFLFTCSNSLHVWRVLTSILLQPSMLSQRIITTTAQGRVATIPGGSASVNLEAHVPSSLVRAKVSIQVTSGTASGQAKAQEPARILSSFNQTQWYYSLGLLSSKSCPILYYLIMYSAICLAWTWNYICHLCNLSM